MRRKRAHLLLDQVLSEMERKGVYGEFSITGKIVDGVIQEDIKGEGKRTFKAPKEG